MDPGMPSLSADVLAGLIPVDHDRRCRITYQRRSGGYPKQQMDGSGVVAPMTDGESSGNLAVDPAAFVDDGVVVHTPAVVMAPNLPQ